jgi:hypothetical protein
VEERDGDALGLPVLLAVAMEEDPGEGATLGVGALEGVTPGVGTLDGLSDQLVLDVSEAEAGIDAEIEGLSEVVAEREALTVAVKVA